MHLTWFFTVPALVLLCWVFPAALNAHPAIDAQVAILNERIEKEPENASLFLKRGQLRQAHREWEAAMDDYRHAAEIDPGLQVARLRLGEAQLNAGRVTDAKRTLDEFLTANADHAEALVLRGRVLQQLGDSDAAVADYSRAIARSARPQPDWYLERARAASADDRNLDRAILGLDEGLVRLGPLVTLQAMAIELELGRHGYEAALARVNDILSRMPLQPQWLVKRAELLARLGRTSESRVSYRTALEVMDALPTSRRNTKLVLDLERQARHSLSAMKPATDLPHSEKE